MKRSERKYFSKTGQFSRKENYILVEPGNLLGKKVEEGDCHSDGDVVIGDCHLNHYDSG